MTYTLKEAITGGLKPGDKLTVLVDSRKPIKLTGIYMNPEPKLRIKNDTFFPLRDTDEVIYQ